MFTDLRGSTQFAESLPPETVVDVINRYLSELTEAILGHGGTLISYLGDGFMAVFGAPIEQEDHADRAVRRGPRDPRRAAAAVQRVAARAGPRRGLHDRGRAQHRPVHGRNVGSEKRLEYTAMGDTINTASRLEGSTKESGFYA